MMLICVKWHRKIDSYKLQMGHSVLMALGLILTFEDDPEEPDAKFEELLARLRQVTTVSVYFSKYSKPTEKFYLLRGCEGYDVTNKAYLIPTSGILWSVSCDGVGCAYFHDGDGLEEPEQWIERIQILKGEVQAEFDELGRSFPDLEQSSSSKVAKTAAQSDAAGGGDRSAKTTKADALGGSGTSPKLQVIRYTATYE